MTRFNVFPSPAISRIKADASVERGASALGRVMRGERIVLSRGLCHFETIQTPPGGRSARAIAAAELAAQARAPFRDAETRLVWHDNRIGVWSWPRSALGPLAGAEAEVIPETLLHAPAEGLVVRTGMDGVEAQFWSEGALRASRWWPDEPGSEALERFARGAGAALEPDAATIVHEPVLGEPPGAPGVLGLERLRAIRPRDLIALALIVFLAPTLYLSAQWVRLDASNASAARELASLDQASGEVIAARAQAMRVAAELDAYSVLDRTHPAAPLAVFAEIAAGQDASLEQFALRANELEIMIAAPDGIAPVDLVAALEADPLIEGVRLEPANTGGLWRLFAELQEPAA
ncbi:MAG: hypothetical protein AAFX09_10470 [Pseudomonadota bacterium]